MTSRIVIIGGGQSGGWAAKTLRDEGFDGEICVVAEEEWDFYERPPLSKRLCWNRTRRFQGCLPTRCSRR